jgi:DNA mismatch repair protein PMS2
MGTFFNLSHCRKSALQLSTNGNKSIKENIANIFGAKILTSLEPLSLKLEIDVRHIGGRRTIETIEVIGYVSKIAHGEGRSSTDRQFFYVNSRPCVQSKVSCLKVNLTLDREDL